ncbi:hypothetical protein AX16_000662 [Volvariella volvacea WC 439]|nr:hypothetical protein AX16_000662 [Volvariella volvacea WC 439]
MVSQHQSTTHQAPPGSELPSKPPLDKLPNEIIHQISNGLDDDILLTFSTMSLRFFLLFLPIVSKRNGFSLDDESLLIQEADKQHILRTFAIAATPNTPLPLNRLKKIHCVLGLNSTLNDKLDRLYKVISSHAELNRITFDLAPTRPWENGYQRVANDYGWMWKFALAFNAAVGQQGSTVRVLADDLRGRWPTHGRPFVHTFSASRSPSSSPSSPTDSADVKRAELISGDDPNPELGCSIVREGKELKRRAPAVDCGDGKDQVLSALFKHLSGLVDRVQPGLTRLTEFGKALGIQQGGVLRNVAPFDILRRLLCRPFSLSLPRILSGHTAGESEGGGNNTATPCWPTPLAIDRTGTGTGRCATRLANTPTAEVLPAFAVAAGTYGPTADNNISLTNHVTRDSNSSNKDDKNASKPTVAPLVASNVKTTLKEHWQDPKLKKLPLVDRPQVEALYIHTPQLLEQPFFEGTMHVLRQAPIVVLSLDRLNLSHYDWTWILREINIPTLKKLALGDSQIAYPDLLNFLVRHPTITHLDLSKGVAIGKLGSSCCLEQRTNVEGRPSNRGGVERNSVRGPCPSEPERKTRRRVCRHQHRHHHQHHHQTDNHHDVPHHLLPELTYLAATPEYLVHFLRHPSGGLPKLREVIMASDYRVQFEVFDFGTFDAVFYCLAERAACSACPDSIKGVGLRLFSSVAGFEDWLEGWIGECRKEGDEGKEAKSESEEGRDHGYGDGYDDSGKRRFGSIQLDRLVIELIGIEPTRENQFRVPSSPTSMVTATAYLNANANWSANNVGSQPQDLQMEKSPDDDTLMKHICEWSGLFGRVGALDCLHLRNESDRVW